MKFLSEGELDSRARLAGPAAEQAQSEEMVKNLVVYCRFLFLTFLVLPVLNFSIQEIEKALAASKREAERSDESAGPSSKRADKTPSKEIQQVMSTTKCSQDDAEKALQEAGGNLDSAVLTILTKSFSKE